MQEYIDLIYACEDHIDLAIDDFLVEYETFPVLSKAEKITCSYCENAAVYVLNKSK
jgi:CxxH/CxxC protein (TIGR04129 family)